MTFVIGIVFWCFRSTKIFLIKSQHLQVIPCGRSALFSGRSWSFRRYLGKSSMTFVIGIVFWCFRKFHFANFSLLLSYYGKFFDSEREGRSTPVRVISFLLLFKTRGCLVNKLSLKILSFNSNFC